MVVTLGGLIIDPEIKDLIPPLSIEELEELEISLVVEGNRVPIDIWQGIIADGHSRYEICQRLGIPLRTPNELKLDNRDALKIWIIRNQFGRRNISTYTRSVLALKLEDLYQAKAKEKQVLAGKEKLPQISAEAIETRRELAKVAHVSHDTIAKVKVIEQKASPKVKEELAKGSDKLSINSVYKDIKREERKAEKERQRQAVLSQSAPIERWLGNVRLDTIVVGNINEIALPDESVDMVFTDPPYQEDCISLYEKLATVSATCLKTGGYLLAYAGKMYIPEILESMSNCLEYISIFAVFQPFSQSRIIKHNLFENWRPILVFKKTGVTPIREWVQDVVRGKRDKGFHDWQQDIEAPLQYIAAYTKPDDVVLDPFIGGGTTACACKELGRHYIAFDMSEDAVKLATERVKNA